MYSSRSRTLDIGDSIALSGEPQATGRCGSPLNRSHQRCIFRHHGQGRTEAVHGSADDAARVARAFAHGIKAGDTGGLASEMVTDHADGATAAGFGTDESRLLQEAATP